jgi:hypothetical protein
MTKIARPNSVRQLNNSAKVVSKAKPKFQDRISENETRADTKMSVASQKKERVKSLKQDVKKEVHIKKVLLNELNSLRKSISLYEKHSRTKKVS